MSERRPGTLTRRGFLSVSVGALVAGAGCGEENKGAGSSSGTGTGGGSNPSSGETGGTSGPAATGGASPLGGSSSSSGGTTSSRGSPSGGNAPGTGGLGTAGGTAPASGGRTGGQEPASGGRQSGGAGTSATGGSAAGGRAAGGASVTGGTSAGGQPSGGATNTGGSGGTSSGETPLVCLVRDSDINKAVKDAIAAVGGFPDLTGKTVVLRPNCIPTDGPPYNTSPEIIRAVIQAIKAKGTPQSIAVADDAYQKDLPTSMAANGIADAATAEGATPTDMKGTATTTVKPDGATNWPDGIIFYQSILDADYVINLPVCKTHSYADFTMAIKAWYGNQINYRNTHPSNLRAALAELHLVRKADFVLLDATKALLNGGPFKGSSDVVVSPGIVVASTDTIALEATGVCIMKHYLKEAGRTGGALNNQTVWQQGVIARAQQLTQLGWITTTTFPYQAIGIDEAATIMAYRDA